MSRALHWCFTLNNYDDEALAVFEAVDFRKTVTYFIYGKEVGESGTPHLQGFISFRNRRRLTQVRRLFGGRAHWERAKGTAAQAAGYCRKDGDFFEFGEVPKGSGDRSDLRALNAAVDAGTSIDEIREKFTSCYYRYHRLVDRLVAQRALGRDWVVDVQVFWGKTGLGKTRAVFQFTDRDQIYVHPGNEWFDGYNGHSVVLFDDFNGSEFKLSYLLKLLDRYPMRVPVKGGFVTWVPKHVFITSNRDPKTWYVNGHPEQRLALFRRISNIKLFE